MVPCTLCDLEFDGKILLTVHQDQEKYDIMPEPDDDENDMLDLAFALTDT